MGGNYYARIITKYGTVEKWAAQQANRLRAWGFNALGEYADTRAWTLMPGVNMVKVTPNSLTGRFVGGCPTKNLLAGVNRTYYTGWVAPIADFFDPCYVAYVSRYVSAYAGGEASVLIKSSRTIGFAMDDRDDLFGFGAGPEIRANTHPHLGWIALVTNFQQSSNANLSPPQTYADPKVYSKYALRDMLQTKYGTIAALNAVWGSNYTTFDSQGGWGVGSGFLDEDGRHPWVPRDFEALKHGTASFVSDLNAWLLAYAQQYFSVTTAAIRRHAPRALVFGPPAFNSEGITRKEILQAAGQYVDVIQAVLSTKQVLDLTSLYSGGKPIVGYMLAVSNPDSALYRYPSPGFNDPENHVSTQAKRGVAYANLLKKHLTFTDRNGVRPVAGINYFELKDNWPEKGGWGLVSLSDNAYDGKEAIIATGTDPWGYRTGGEERNYGDFLSQVVTANAGVAAAIGAVPKP
jgi:hypothetical protein